MMAHALDIMGADYDRFVEDRRGDLASRVSKKRLKHIEGVAETAQALARAYGVDERKAYLAGLLHDWDKGFDDDGIRQRAVELGIDGEIDPLVMQEMPQVLHGPTAARALEREYPDIPADVIVAIRNHTTASVDADDLEKVLYIADAIEPGRRFEAACDLRAMVGEASLDDLFFAVYRFWTIALLERGRTLHPDTMTIYNSLVMKRKDARCDKEKGTSARRMR